MDEWGWTGERRKTKYTPLSGWNKQIWMECTSCGWRGKMITAPECTACGMPALKPTRQRVFVNSLSDLFEDRQEVLPWRNEFFALSQMYPNMDYLLLTKRPENIARFAPRDWMRFGWPKNIWLGVSVENQARADERIPLLLKVPAAIKWLSVEPMLENINIGDGIILRFLLNWVVVGGESGPGCRPMDVKWAHSVRDQCKHNGVAFYMKQLGGETNHRSELADLPKDLQIREWPQVEAVR